jgi:cyanate permease
LKRRLGEEIFGYTYGVWYFFVVVTLLIGPIVAGFLYDATGNYSLALVFLLMASLVAGVLALIVASGKSHVPHVSAS